MYTEEHTIQVQVVHGSERLRLGLTTDETNAIVFAAIASLCIVSAEVYQTEMVLGMTEHIPITIDIVVKC